MPHPRTLVVYFSLFSAFSSPKLPRQGCSHPKRLSLAAAAPPMSSTYTRPDLPCPKRGQTTSHASDTSPRRLARCQSPQCQRACPWRAEMTSVGISHHRVSDTSPLTPVPKRLLDYLHGPQHETSPDTETQALGPANPRPRTHPIREPRLLKKCFPLGLRRPCSLALSRSRHHRRKGVGRIWRGCLSRCCWGKDR